MYRVVPSYITLHPLVVRLLVPLTLTLLKIESLRLRHAHRELDVAVTGDIPNYVVVYVVVDVVVYLGCIWGI